MRGRLEEIEVRRARLRTEIEEKSLQLKRLGVEASATRGKSHLDAPRRRATKRVAGLSAEVDRLRERLATDGAVASSLRDYAARMEAGGRDPGSLRAHIARGHRPASEADLRVGRVAEAWAAVSVGLMLVIFVAIVLFERQQLIGSLVLSIAVVAFVEAGFRGRIVNLVSSANVGLAVVAALIIAYEFFWQLVVAAVLVIGLYVLWDNLRELHR